MSVVVIAHVPAANPAATYTEICHQNPYNPRKGAYHRSLGSNQPKTQYCSV